MELSILRASFSVGCNLLSVWMSNRKTFSPRRQPCQRSSPDCRVRRLAAGTDRQWRVLFWRTERAVSAAHGRAGGPRGVREAPAAAQGARGRRHAGLPDGPARRRPLRPLPRHQAPPGQASQSERQGPGKAGGEGGDRVATPRRRRRGLSHRHAVSCASASFLPSQCAADRGEGQVSAGSSCPAGQRQGDRPPLENRI